MLKIGIDSSTTNTAIVLIDDGIMIDYTLISPKGKDILDRSLVIVVEVIEFIVKRTMLYKQDIKIGIESASFHSIGARDKLAMLIGGIYYWLRALSYNVELFPPSTVKKKFTGNGIATKDYMLEYVPTECIIKFKKLSRKIDDLVDAYAIATIL